MAEGPDNTVDDHLRRGRKREREERERERERESVSHQKTNTRETDTIQHTNTSFTTTPSSPSSPSPYLLVLGGDAEYGGEAVHVHGLEELVEVDAMLGEILEILFKN